MDGVVLRQLPYPAADRLVTIFDTNRELAIDRTGAASGNIDDWPRQTRSFEGIAGYYTMGRTLSTETSDVVLTAQVSADVFPLTRVTPPLRSGPTRSLSSATISGGSASVATLTSSAAR